MGDDNIIIKGNRQGINAVIDIDKFECFDDMLPELLEKLSKGKTFYKGCTFRVTINLKSISERNMEKLKSILLDEIEVKEVIFEEKNTKEVRTFNGVYEGKTKFIRKTVRGGQTVNFPGNIVIIGDVNSGSEITAGGNIIVLGSVRGNVSAGASGNRKAIIAAFSLQPEVLKIANIITISPDDCEKPQYPEVAKIKDEEIIVEPYLPNKYIY